MPTSAAPITRHSLFAENLSGPWALSLIALPIRGVEEAIEAGRIAGDDVPWRRRLSGELSGDRISLEQRERADSGLGTIGVL